MKRKKKEYRHGEIIGTPFAEIETPAGLQRIVPKTDVHWLGQAMLQNELKRQHLAQQGFNFPHPTEEQIGKWYQDHPEMLPEQGILDQEPEGLEYQFDEQTKQQLSGPEVDFQDIPEIPKPPEPEVEKPKEKVKNLNANLFKIQASQLNTTRGTTTPRVGLTSGQIESVVTKMNYGEQITSYELDQMRPLLMKSVTQGIPLLQQHDAEAKALESRIDQALATGVGLLEIMQEGTSVVSDYAMHYIAQKADETDNRGRARVDVQSAISNALARQAEADRAKQKEELIAATRERVEQKNKMLKEQYGAPFDIYTVDEKGAEVVEGKPQESFLAALGKHEESQFGLAFTEEERRAKLFEMNLWAVEFGADYEPYKIDEKGDIVPVDPQMAAWVKQHEKDYETYFAQKSAEAFAEPLRQQVEEENIKFRALNAPFDIFKVTDEGKKEYVSDEAKTWHSAYTTKMGHEELARQTKLSAVVDPKFMSPRYAWALQSGYIPQDITQSFLDDTSIEAAFRASTFAQLHGYSYIDETGKIVTVQPATGQKAASLKEELRKETQVKEFLGQVVPEAEMIDIGEIEPVDRKFSKAGEPTIITIPDKDMKTLVRRGVALFNDKGKSPTSAAQDLLKDIEATQADYEGLVIELAGKIADDVNKTKLDEYQRSQQVIESEFNNVVAAAKDQAEIVIDEIKTAGQYYKVDEDIAQQALDLMIPEVEGDTAARILSSLKKDNIPGELKDIHQGIMLQLNNADTLRQKHEAELRDIRYREAIRTVQNNMKRGLLTAVDYDKQNNPVYTTFDKSDQSQVDMYYRFMDASTSERKDIETDLTSRKTLRRKHTQEYTKLEDALQKDKVLIKSYEPERRVSAGIVRAQQTEYYSEPRDEEDWDMMFDHIEQTLMGSPDLANRLIEQGFEAKRRWQDSKVDQLINRGVPRTVAMRIIHDGVVNYAGLMKDIQLKDLELTGEEQKELRRSGVKFKQLKEELYEPKVKSKKQVDYVSPLRPRQAIPDERFINELKKNLPSKENIPAKYRYETMEDAEKASREGKIPDSTIILIGGQYQYYTEG